MGARHIDENTVRKRGCRTHLHVLLADEDGALGAVFFGVLPAAANHNVEGHESWFAALFLNLFDGTCTKAKKGLNVSHRCPRRPVPTLRRARRPSRRASGLPCLSREHPSKRRSG